MIDFEDKNEQLRYVIARGHTPASKLYINSSETGNHLEVNPQSALAVENIASRLNQTGSGEELKLNKLFEAFPRFNAHLLLSI